MQEAQMKIEVDIPPGEPQSFQSHQESQAAQGFESHEPIAEQAHSARSRGPRSSIDILSLPAHNQTAPVMTAAHLQFETTASTAKLSLVSKALRARTRREQGHKVVIPQTLAGKSDS